MSKTLKLSDNEFAILSIRFKGEKSIKLVATTFDGKIYYRIPKDLQIINSHKIVEENYQFINFKKYVDDLIAKGLDNTWIRYLKFEMFERDGTLTKEFKCYGNDKKQF